MSENKADDIPYDNDVTIINKSGKTKHAYGIEHKSERDFVKEKYTTFLHNDDTKESNANSFKSIHGKQFECDICKKSFSLQRTLKNHIFTHTGEKPHKCDKCKKSFLLKYALKMHKFTHISEKPFKCNICKKSFARNGILKSHMLTHTGGKPFNCNTCKKSFVYNAALKSDMFTHTCVEPHFVPGPMPIHLETSVVIDNCDLINVMYVKNRFHLNML